MHSWYIYAWFHRKLGRICLFLRPWRNLFTGELEMPLDGYRLRTEPFCKWKMNQVKKVRVNIKSGPHSQTTICGFGIHGISTQTDSVSARTAFTQEGFDLHTPRVFGSKRFTLVPSTLRSCHPWWHCPSMVLTEFSFSLMPVLGLEAKKTR